MHLKTRRLSVVAVGLATMLLFTRSTVANAADATVDLTAPKQMIRGFGASSAWCGTVSTSVMDSLYKDLGYSILRVRIEEGIGDAWQTGDFSAWDTELSNAKNAVARGAIVFASPWNPPASMVSGGKLMTSKYPDYANYLKAYAKYFSDSGAPLYAISIQNEPDFAATWTAWSATDLLNFLTTQGATLSSSVRVLMPESFQFIHAMSDPSLSDPTVASYISVVGGHLYGGTIQSYPLAQSQGKELWETEHYFDDDTITNIMDMAKEIHDCMVTASMNAYVYWWITYGNGLATSDGTIYKRAYTLGQFAKYIRPGYFRVDATATPATNVYVSAYAGGSSVAIVAINTGSASVDQTFVLNGGSASQVSSWQTTANANMAAGQSYQPSGGSFMATLPAQSITTFVGTLSSPVAFDGGASDAASAPGDQDSAATGPDSGTGAYGGSGGTASSGGATAGSGGSSANGGSSTDAGGSGAASGGGGTNPGTATAGSQSSGCALGGGAGGEDTRNPGGGVGVLLVLCGLGLARRRAHVKDPRITPTLTTTVTR